MRIVWSLPVRHERLSSSRGDLVRARFLIEALRSEGHDVTVIEDAARGHTQVAVHTYRTWVRSWLPARLALVLRDIGRVLQGCVHGAQLAVSVRRMRPDLLIETQVAYAVSGAIATSLTGVPLVLDDCSPTAEERAFGAGLPALGRATLALQARAAHRIVAVSASMVATLADEGLGCQKIVCIPNGIDVEAFTHAARDDWRARLGLENRCVIVFVGSFQPWHRADLLIEAVAAVSAEYPLHVILAGDGPGLDAVQQAAGRRGVARRVTAIGAVPADAIPALLASCDVGVLPHSNAYGDPMKLREYAAAGLPSIAPDLGPVREVVEHDATGLLFAPENVPALVQAIERLAGDPAVRRRLGDEARRRALAGGSWVHRARALLDGAPRVSGPLSCTVTPIHVPDGPGLRVLRADGKDSRA